MQFERRDHRGRNIPLPWRKRTSTETSTPVASVPPCEMTNTKRQSREVDQTRKFFAPDRSGVCG